MPASRTGGNLQELVLNSGFCLNQSESSQLLAALTIETHKYGALYLGYLDDRHREAPVLSYFQGFASRLFFF